jgi:AhpD family alkylhydroperoxidase
MPFKEISNEARQQSLELFKAAPGAMQAFQSLMRVASGEGELSPKTKELMALAIAISVKCEGCIVFHVQNAIRHGSSRQEVIETIVVAIEMGGGPATVYGGKALAAFDELAKPRGAVRS